MIQFYQNIQRKSLISSAMLNVYKLDKLWISKKSAKSCLYLISIYKVDWKKDKQIITFSKIIRVKQIIRIWFLGSLVYLSKHQLEYYLLQFTISLNTLYYKVYLLLCFLNTFEIMVFLTFTLHLYKKGTYISAIFYHFSLSNCTLSSEVEALKLWKVLEYNFVLICWSFRISATN